MDELEKQIYAVFPFLESIPINVIPNEDVEEMAETMPQFNRSGVLGILPIALLKVKKARSQKVLGKSGELLISFLDGRLFEEKNNPDVKRLRRLRQYMFVPFSKEQCEVVIAWLEAVALPKYGKTCLPTIDSALAFWKSKLKRKMNTKQAK